MEVIQLVVNGFGENTYILADMKTHRCAIVDPGLSDDEEKEAFVKAVEKYQLTPEQLINTHLHVDHIMGNAFVADKYKLKVSAHEADSFLGMRAREQARMFGIPMEIKDTAIDTFLEDGDEVKVGESTMHVISVPGHSPGSIALYCKESHFVVTGDALFAGSIGRTDLPGGDFDTLINSLTRRLMALPDDTVVYPGHGPATTIGKEKIQNPYLRHNL